MPGRNESSQTIELQIDITYDQVFALVKQLPKKEKIKLTKDLEKEGIETKLSGLLKTFHTKGLSLKTINEEVEIVRQKIYERQKYSQSDKIPTFVTLPNN